VNYYFQSNSSRFLISAGSIPPSLGRKLVENQQVEKRS
jgi:hypothetical protein